MHFEFSNVVDHFPLQNSRSSFFEQGGLDADIIAKWGYTWPWWKHIRRHMEEQMETHDEVFVLDWSPFIRVLLFYFKIYYVLEVGT